MALRLLLARWPISAGVAAATLGVGGAALCEKDASGPSFDPEALERGAKALREINSSPHARRVRSADFVFSDLCTIFKDNVAARVCQAGDAQQLAGTAYSDVQAHPQYSQAIEHGQSALRSR